MTFSPLFPARTFCWVSSSSSYNPYIPAGTRIRSVSRLLRSVVPPKAITLNWGNGLAHDTLACLARGGARWRVTRGCRLHAEGRAGGRGGCLHLARLAAPRRAVRRVPDRPDQRSTCGRLDDPWARLAPGRSHQRRRAGPRVDHGRLRHLLAVELKDSARPGPRCPPQAPPRPRRLLCRPRQPRL